MFRGHGRFWRIVAKWTACVSLIIVGAGAAGWPVYVRPQVDPLRQADAVLVLGGYESARFGFGNSLVLAGWAPILVQSMASAAKAKFCPTPEPRRLCFVPDPMTTEGEGRELRQLAAEHGWKRVIVVTFRPHISRARFILQRCFPGELIMVASPADISPARWIYEYIYQSAGYVKAAFSPDC